MKKICRSTFKRLYEMNENMERKIIDDTTQELHTIKYNHGLSRSVVILYLFLLRMSTEVTDHSVIDNFSRNTIIDDMKSVMPWIDKSTMYRAFDVLLELGWVTYKVVYDYDGYYSSTDIPPYNYDKTTLYLLGITDGQIDGGSGWVYISDFFFTTTFYKLSANARRFFLYIYQAIGNTDKKANSNHTESFRKIYDKLKGLPGFCNAYKIFNAIKELNIKKIVVITDFRVIENLIDKVFTFRLTSLNNTAPAGDYIIDYEKRHQKKAHLIRTIFESELTMEEKKRFRTYTEKKQLNYIIKALFKKKTSTIKGVMSRYIGRLREGVDKSHNTYRYVQQLCQYYS